MCHGSDWLEKLISHPKSDISKLANEFSSKYIEISGDVNEVYDNDFLNMEMFDQSDLKF